MYDSVLEYAVFKKDGTSIDYLSKEKHYVDQQGVNKNSKREHLEYSLLKKNRASCSVLFMYTIECFVDSVGELTKFSKMVL